jgi:polyhydroxyalkanoate synthesis regulator phasin
MEEVASSVEAEPAAMGGSYEFESADAAGAPARAAPSYDAPPAPPQPVQVAEAGQRTTPTPPQGPAGRESGEPGDASQVADAGSTGPLLIYEAEVNLAVHEVREKIQQVIAISDAIGGYLQQQDENLVVIRVPAAQFREALRRVEEVGDVLARRITAQDVTEQFRDTRIRLRNAMQMRDRMAELLERADTVPDSLVIQQELERLTETIELLSGQLRSLEGRIAFSTITVRFQPVQTDVLVPREQFRLPFPWLDMLGLPHLMELL